MFPEEASIYKDILLENFVDTYMNLTLKSMFMLKYIDNCVAKKHSRLTRPNKTRKDDNEQKLEFILKSDDNCYVNIGVLKSAVGRWRSQTSRRKSMIGYKIDLKEQKIPIIRPTGHGSIQEDVAKRFEVPIWMYQGMNAYTTNLSSCI